MLVVHTTFSKFIFTVSLRWRVVLSNLIKRTPKVIQKLEELEFFSRAGKGQKLQYEFLKNFNSDETHKAYYADLKHFFNFYKGFLTGNVLPEFFTDDPFDALNALYCTSAIQIEFDDSKNETIELIFENTANSAIFPRLFIQCNKGAKGTVILNFQGAEQNASFINVSTYVNVGENANLSIHKIQKNGADTFDLQREYVDQAANSTFTMNTFPLSGRLTRNDLKINVNGNNCETFMNGAYTLKGKSHCDNHTTVDHKVAHCYSKELYKGVIDDRATNVFNGKVFVRKDAQKINAFQSNANILLSDTGTVNSKPELEIYADDVKCSHGSTTGQLDDEAVFYLRSRGLSEKAAKELLVKAFLGEVLEEVENEEVKSYVEAQIEKHFSA